MASIMARNLASMRVSSIENPAFAKNKSRITTEAAGRVFAVRAGIDSPHKDRTRSESLPLATKSATDAARNPIASIPTKSIIETRDLNETSQKYFLRSFLVRSESAPRTVLITVPWY